MPLLDHLGITVDDVARGIEQFDPVMTALGLIRLDAETGVSWYREGEAEIILMGVEEPRCLIHAPNESVDPAEIEHMSLVEALFLRDYAGG